MRKVLTILLVMGMAAAPAAAAGQVSASSPAPAVAPSQEQAPAVTAVTLDEAVSRALARNPTVARAATAIARADALLAQARAVTLPSLSANLSNTTLDTGVSFDENDVIPRNQFTFSATASVPVLAPARWARRTQAQDQIAVAEASVTTVRQQVAVAAAEAYLSVIAAQRQVEVDERAVVTARAHLDYARARLEGGAGSRLNMLRAAQASASAEVRLERTRFANQQAQEALGVLVAEDGPVVASANPRFEIPAEDADQAWRTSRPDLIQQSLTIRAAERVVRDSWKDVAPAATLSFDPQYVTPSGLFQPSRSWRLTFGITQPIFQGGLQRAVTRQRQVALDEASLAFGEAELQARSDIRVARAAVASAERARQSAELAASQAEEVLQITTEAFRLGATTNIEVIDAQRSDRDAETEAALAADALERARLQLLVALGRFPN
jgi:outer membrane protein TolC